MSKEHYDLSSALLSLPLEIHSHVTEYLSIKQTRSLAYANKEWYNLITETARLITPITLVPWCIVEALSMREGLYLFEEDQQIASYNAFIESGGKIKQLSHKILIGYEFGPILFKDATAFLHELTHFESIDIDFGGCQELNFEHVTVPMFPKLKTLKITEPPLFVHQWIQNAPNLTDLSLSVINGEPPATVQVDKELTEFIGNTCKGLTCLNLKSNKYMDNAIVSMLANLPVLKKLYLSGKIITGTLFKEIGRVGGNLEELEVLISLDEQAYAECPKLTFGGGVLTKLRTLSLVGEFDFTDTAESLLKCAPNTRDVWFTLSTERDTEFFIDYVRDRNLDSINLSHRWEYAVTNNVFEAILQQKSLKKIVFEWRFSIDQLKNAYMPSLREYDGEFEDNLEWIEAFHNAFPNIQTINVAAEFVTIKEYLEDPNHFVHLIEYGNYCPNQNLNRPGVENKY